MIRRAATPVTVLAGYLLLTLLFIIPGIRNLDSYILGGLTDAPESVWAFWWLKYSVFEHGLNPLVTDMNFYPAGVNLVFSSIPKLTAALSVPLQWFLPLEVTYNIFWLLAFATAGLAAYYLALHVTGERLPALAAGAFFAFSPYHFGQHSHMTLLPTALIPLYILLLIKGAEALERSDRRAGAYFPLAGFVLGLSAYDTEHYAIYLVLFSIVYLGFKIVAMRRRGGGEWLPLGRWLLVTMEVAAIIFLPVLAYAGTSVYREGDYVNVPTADLVTQSADSLALFVPDKSSYFFAGLTDPLSWTFEHETAYLGWTVLLLAAVGFSRWRDRGQAWLWLVAALVFTLFSLGPFLKFFGVETPVPGLYALVYKLPLLGSTRAISRFVVIATLALAVLGGMGVAVIVRRLRRLARPAPAIAAAMMALSLVFFVEVKPNVMMFSAAAPEAYVEIARAGGGGSVVEVPLGWESAITGKLGHPQQFTEYYQTIHKRPLVGGEISRGPEEMIREGAGTAVLRYLSNPGSEPEGDDLDPVEIDKVMREYQIAFIVLHRYNPEIYCQKCRGGFSVTAIENMDDSTVERLDRYITGTLGMVRFAEDDNIIAYRRP